MKIKSLALAATVVLTATSVFADYGRTIQGTWTAGGSMLFDNDTEKGRDIQLTFSTGMYLENGWMIGGYCSFLDNDWYNSSSIGATTKWHFWDFGWDGESVPFSMYLGCDLGIGHLKTGVASNTAFVIGARLGLDFFLTDYCSLGIAADIHTATDDIYTKSSDITNSDMTVKFSVMFYW